MMGSTIARGVLTLGLAVGCACGQGLPAAAPTTGVAPNPAGAPAVQRTNGAGSAAQRLRVTWVGGILTVNAENSSLNGILREVSRQTGMKVTGGVADERVYGTYGPGAPEAVLDALLLGTGSNMLLKENTANAPMELVLTPRRGGATPPGPSSYATRGGGEDDLPPMQRDIRSGSLPADRTALPGNSIPAGAPAIENSENLGSAAQPAAATTTDQQSPNGVKTPQQIYDQLMKLQQQKAAAPPQ